MRIMFDIGGSILVPDKPDLNEIKKRAEEISKVHEVHDPLVVVGGGQTARDYIEVGDKLGADETFLDMLGVDATKLNAKLLIKALGDEAYSSVISDFESAKEVFLSDGIPVMGGTHPGHTTDAVTALAGEYLNADLLVVVSNVDGVYDKDPNVDESVEKLDRITSDELEDIAMKAELGAGLSVPVDFLASRIINRSGIRTVLVGKDESLLDVIEGNHDGTEIVSND